MCHHLFTPKLLRGTTNCNQRKPSKGHNDFLQFWCDRHGTLQHLTPQLFPFYYSTSQKSKMKHKSLAWGWSHSHQRTYPFLKNLILIKIFFLKFKELTLCYMNYILAKKRKGKKKPLNGMVAYKYNPNIWEIRTQGDWECGQPRLHSEILSQKGEVVLRCSSAVEYSPRMTTHRTVFGCTPL